MQLWVVRVQYEELMNRRIIQATIQAMFPDTSGMQSTCWKSECINSYLQLHDGPRSSQVNLSLRFQANYV